MNFRKVLTLFLLAPALLTPGASALNNARHSHTSTLLPDGDILVAGGTLNTATVTDSVETYSMASNSYINWTAGAVGLVTARSSHTATLMSDGNVLIAGGFSAAGQPIPAVDAYEICNPITRTCTNAGVPDMLTPRGGHTATLLSKGPRAGQVLLCGGRTGTTGTAITENCETFNPAGPAVLAAGSMISPREGHAATLLYSGKIFVTGGRRRDLADSAWIYEPMNEMYDPAAGAGAGVWTPVAALLQGRINHTATVLNNGKIMIAGGYNDVNSLRCIEDEDSIEEDCWHIKFYDTGQNPGNWGYLDGAEFFDQNGARVIIQEMTYGGTPYRVSQHTAALEPDGRWRMHGGYGNIYPTFFTDSPALTSDSVINLTPTGSNTATIDNTSLIKFPLIFQLSRPVSGRLVDADAFFSRPPPAVPAAPSITQDTVKFYIPAITAPVDGSPVGLLLGGDHEPGDFDDIVQLQAPQGTAVFTEQSGSSGDSPVTTVVSSVFAISTLFPEVTDRPISGSVNAQVRLTVPDTYRSIVGVASVQGGGITDVGGIYSINLGAAGSGAFDTGAAAPLSCDTVAQTCIFAMNINFTGVSGIISNLTTLLPAGTTVYQAAPPPDPAMDSSVNTADSDEITLSLKFNYVARQVSVLDRAPAYTFTRSTMVIRGMVFSNQLAYSPSGNVWSEMSQWALLSGSTVTAGPSFNHTALVTPAGDTVLIGGRSCEFKPDVDCLRTAMRFSTRTVDTAMISVYRGADGSNAWPVGEELNSKRAFHTSTLLPDGGILTCGGSDGAKQLATCERMDPQTKKWALTGSMNLPRANHTASLLPNGNVLAAGGVTQYGIAVSSAEIYYPQTGRWVPTASMANARQLHTATLLPDGNVLVAGGATLSTYSATAEIYISSAAYWTGTVNNMVDGRSQHTATLLKNGNVLMAGGVNGLGAMRQTETYDYLARTFSGGPNLNTARYAHTANQLRDGNVIVIGGSNGINSGRTCEIYNGTNWTTETAPNLNYNRANHRSVLLPNGKIMLTGGELSGVAQSSPESFDPDYRGWSFQGGAAARTHHTSVLTRDNLLINIGGWNGGNYLASTEYVDFNFYPDMHGLEAETTRQAMISSADRDLFNQGDRITLLSNTSNFHGITEASGGGAGPANASFHNPRVYMQQIDNPSGFMVDLSTRIYSLYDAANPNPSWEKTLSSITIITPGLPGVMPHGWYHMRVAAAGVFSDAYTVQVTTPRPTGTPSVATGTVLGVSSITWSWTSGDVIAADGYYVYSATDNVFITAVDFSNSVLYTQTGLAPNTAASVMVGAYNLGGSGALSKSATYYTLAARPEPLRVVSASFESATLEWARNQNSELTTYELSMYPTTGPLVISTPVPFSVNYTSTSTVISQLSANQEYAFRVRARNGAGIITELTTAVTTITVSGVNNFTGEALSSSTINWSWDAALGATYYELYDITAGTAAAVFIGSSTSNNISQTGLSANVRYQAAVNAVKTVTGGPIRGPVASAEGVYTLTVPPLPATPNIYTNISTGSLNVNWITNGNSTWTVYRVTGALDSDFSETTSAETIDSYMSFTTLSPNVRYFLRLTPINGDGKEGATLDLGSKYTLAKVPASLSAVDISMSGITLSWNTDGNSPETIYEVRSSTNENFSAPIVTPVPFTVPYYDSTAFVNGLLTSTTYYFDVAARNGESIVTARKRAPAAITLPGPSGAPSGSIGGTSDPAAATTISGSLPNNRTVNMYIPAGSFASATPIAISSSTRNDCGYLPGGSPVAIEIFSQDSAQPQVPVTLTINFSPTEANAGNGIVPNAANVVMARFNPDTMQCLPLETKVNVGERTITATLNHFSLFQLMVRVAASNLNSVLIYPNPFYANRGQGFVTIDKIPASSKVRVYTLSGDKVWETTAGSTGVVIWKGVNKSGYLVASGIYLVVVDASSGKKVFKLAVER